MLAYQPPSYSDDAHARPLPALSISRAAAEAHEQRQAWRAALEADVRRYESVRVTDSVLARVEEINLGGAGVVPGVHIAAWKRELAATLRRPLPAGVRYAHNGHELHSALLDWQDQLLDEAIPERRRFTREDEQIATRLAMSNRLANQLLLARSG